MNVFLVEMEAMIGIYTSWEKAVAAVRKYVQSKVHQPDAYDLMCDDESRFDDFYIWGDYITVYEMTPDSDRGILGHSSLPVHPLNTFALEGKLKKVKGQFSKTLIEDVLYKNRKTDETPDLGI
jgi:hypothetical protein